MFHDRCLQYTHHDQVLTAISNGFAKLEFQRTTSTTSTIAEGNATAREHVSYLRSEMRQLTRTMTIPWVRSGLQFGAEQAIQELAAKLQAPSTPTPTSGSMAGLSVRGVRRQAAGAGGDRYHREAVGDDINVEKGPDSAASRRPRPTRQVSRKNLVDNVMTIKKTFFGLIYIHSNDSSRRALSDLPCPRSHDPQAKSSSRPSGFAPLNGC